MRVAIMTLPLGKNYGGIIQAWALQQVLKNAGHEPLTIDRQADPKGPVYHVARLGFRALKKAVGKRKAPINFERYLPIIQQHTQAFIGQHLSVSEPLDSTAKLNEYFEREHYDAVIVGSDQTWRPRYSSNIENFFLDFLRGRDIKRIAYASSFGVDEWEFTEEEAHRCALLAKQFDAISVRETSGMALCQKYLAVEATHVLDPTLLLERQAYEALYTSKEAAKREGIYTYILDPADWKKQVVETSKRILQKSEYSNQPKANATYPISSRLTDYIIPSVEGWIKGFADADLVITDSFHGIVFSIIFNKPFISLINPSRGASRFSSLLDKLGLMNRLLTKYDQAQLENLLVQEIDYGQVSEILNKEKKKSISFLFEQLCVPKQSGDNLV